MSRVPISQDVADNQKAQKAKIYNMFNEAIKPQAKTEVITKAEFGELYPAEKFEHYSLEAVHKFRQEIMKSEDITDKDGAFKKATSDLKHLVVHGDGKQVIVFAREKQKGE